MGDVENVAKQPTGKYGEARGFDWDHIEHMIAKIVITFGYAWFCFYLMLIYRPVGEHEAGGSNDMPYETTLSKMKEMMCPRDQKGSVIFTCVWIYPAFFSFTFIAFFTRRLAFKPQRQKLLAGDMDFKLWSWIGVGIPCLIFFSYYMYYKWPGNKEYESDGKRIEDMAGTWANRFGQVGMVALTFFMIPASRHGPVLNLMGWHPYHACTIHMFAGWLSFWTSWLHFLGYIAKYSTDVYPTSRSDLCMEEQGGWPGYRWIIPPKICFTYNNQKDYEWYNPDTNTTEMIDPPCFRDCGKQINGFYGTVAIVAFTILAITSMQFMRRYKYTVFYFSHIICAPIFIFFVVMHWKFIYYWFVPSACYYFATQAPFLVQYSRKTVDNYGLKVTSVMDIPTRQSPKGAKAAAPEEPQRSLISRIFSPDSMDWLDEQLNRRGPQAKSIEHCVSFDFEVSEEGFEQFYPGMYGNIWCPDASMKSHPFSVTHVPGRTDQLRIIFRVFGKWTDLLARSLIQLPEPGYQQERLPIPKIMMDGWHGPDHLVGSALNHDKVTIVTAGIGITAFLSMFTEMIEVLCFKKDGLFVKMDEIHGEPLTKEFSLHWSCRDENLIKYITDEYFQPLIEESEQHGGCLEDYSGVRCVIHIHRTGEAGAKTLNPNSLWKSFRDKTERGVREIDYTLLGTFGTPWVPYRFSFGRYKEFYKHIPSVLMFTTCLWVGWAGAQQMGFWLWPNVFGFPPQLRNFFRPFFYLPIVGFSFVIAWIGHIIFDWFVNVESSKMKKQQSDTCKTVDDAVDTFIGQDDEKKNSDLYSSRVTPGTTPAKSMMSGGRIGANGEFVEEDSPSGVLYESKMIVLDSTSGRPDLVSIMDKPEWESTGVYMCGPEKLIEGCKNAAGTLSCAYGADRLQNMMHGNKFCFYEEKFEW